MGGQAGTSPRTELYVISSRKPDPDFAKISQWESRKREAYLHVPKRAGTYSLLTAAFGPNIEEEDLRPVVDRETGLPLDTDLVERAAHGAVRPNDTQEAVENSIASRLWSLGEDPLLIYVHGFNTVAAEAIRSAVKIQEHLDRLGIGVTIVVFHWPSAGHLMDYFPDQKAAGRFGSYALVNLLMSLRRGAGAKRPLHCIAHSMGTYVVTRALNMIATLQMTRFLQPPPDRNILSEVAYMQSDIDYDCLCSGYEGPAYDSPSYLEIPDGYAATGMAERLTIYCSTNDVALFTSLFKNRTKRLGAYGPGLEVNGNRDRLMADKVRDNVHVVNCDDWCVFDVYPSHSHSHFSDCPWMMADVACVLRGDAQDEIRSRGSLSRRWYQLRYDPAPRTPSAQVLRRTAWAWKWIGSLAVNEPMIVLVKAKKAFEVGFRIGNGIVAVFLICTTGILAWVTRHPLWLAAFAACAGALAVYVPTWLWGRAVQKREDEMPVPGLPASEAVIRKVTLDSIGFWVLHGGTGRPDEAMIREGVRKYLAESERLPYEGLLQRVVHECVESIPVKIDYDKIVRETKVDIPPGWWGAFKPRPRDK